MEQNRKNIKKLNIFLGVVTVSMVLLLGLLIWLLSEARNGNRWVNHTLEVKHQTQLYTTSYRRYLARERGFILTGDSVFLNDRKELRIKCYAVVSNITLLTADNQNYKACNERLEKLTDSIFIYSDLSFQNLQNIPLRNRYIVLQDRIVNEIYVLINFINREENILLNQRTADVQRIFVVVYVSVFALIAFAVFLLYYSYYNIKKQFLINGALIEQLRSHEAELIETNIRLENSNTELAQFAFVASHDLQEPLRKIQTFSKMINDREQSGLSDEGKLLFEKINQSAARMKKLIESILSYSRAGNKSDPFQRVDLNTVVQSVTEQLSESIQEKNVILHIAQLPVIDGYKIKIEQVFMNLMTNAIKFRKINENCIITIEYEKTSADGGTVQSELKKGATYHKITFSDNGIGFDEAYSEKIFQMFQRLNPKDAYEGTGIGLAIVKKIIEVHHGAIYVQSKPGEGARFTLYFPA